MPPRIYAKVRPELLVWARETAGLTIPEAAKKIGIDNPDNLAAVEAGQRQLTVTQLRNAAGAYQRPLAAFFLGAPPPNPEMPRDFRSLVDQGRGPSSALLLELRRARQRRRVAGELLERLNIEPPRFDLIAERQERPGVVAGRVRSWLGVELDQQKRWRQRNQALNGWIAVLEVKGVLVFQTSDLDPGEVRGFSLSDEVLPVITLSGKDSPNGRVFTLMHELVHLALRLSALCDPIRVFEGATPDQRLERLCNDVAGRVLVPSGTLEQEVARRGIGSEWRDVDIADVASTFAVSREVIVLRLLQEERVTSAFAQFKLADYKRQYEAARERDKSKKKSVPVPVPRMTIRNNGRAFTRLVLDALGKDEITLADFSEYLGVRLKHFDEIAAAVAAGESGE